MSFVRKYAPGNACSSFSLKLKVIKTIISFVTFTHRHSDVKQMLHQKVIRNQLAKLYNSFCPIMNKLSQGIKMKSCTPGLKIRVVNQVANLQTLANKIHLIRPGCQFGPV